MIQEKVQCLYNIPDEGRWLQEDLMRVREWGDKGIPVVQHMQFAAAAVAAAISLSAAETGTATAGRVAAAATEGASSWAAVKQAAGTTRSKKPPRPVFILPDGLVCPRVRVAATNTITPPRPLPGKKEILSFCFFLVCLHVCFSVGELNSCSCLELSHVSSG